MPRCRSSGALSICSNADTWFRVGNFSCSTLVIAAVKVVFPWSMCPIVPMLTCGFVRSNFAFATEAPPGFSPRRSRGVSWVTSQLADLTRPKFCGRFRSGQTQSLWSISFPPCFLNDLLGDVLRGLSVGVELHRVRSLTRGLGPQVAAVAEHLRQRDERFHNLVAMQVVHRLNMAAPCVEITDHSAEVSLRSGHFDCHHRLQQRRVGAPRG